MAILNISISVSDITFGKAFQHQSRAKLTTEPQHNKTNKMTCAPSKNSDQPGHSPHLISLHGVLNGSPRFLHADSKDSDQPGHSPGLISLHGVLNGSPRFLHASEKTDQTGQNGQQRLIKLGRCTGRFIDFVMLWLISCPQYILELSNT